MEKKIIKFSLVGVICVLVLVLAIGTGIVVFSIRNSENEEKESKSVKESSKLEEGLMQDKGNNEKEGVFVQERMPEKKEEAEEVTEYKDIIEVNGEEQEIEFKIYKSDLGYKMAYDVGSFYVQHSDIDAYMSLYTDTISLSVSKENGDFVAKTEELIQGTNDNRKENDTYVLNQMDVNGKLCLKEELTDALGVTYVNYYIEGNSSSSTTSEYFVVKAICGKELKDSTLKIIDKMVQSFVVMQ